MIRVDEIAVCFSPEEQPYIIRDSAKELSAEYSNAQLKVMAARLRAAAEMLDPQ